MAGEGEPPYKSDGSDGVVPFRDHNFLGVKINSSHIHWTRFLYLLLLKISNAHFRHLGVAVEQLLYWVYSWMSEGKYSKLSMQLLREVNLFFLQASVQTNLLLWQLVSRLRDFITFYFSEHVSIRFLKCQFSLEGHNEGVGVKGTAWDMSESCDGYSWSRVGYVERYIILDYSQ